MKFVHPEINKVFDTNQGKVHSILIESPDFFRRFLTEVNNQICGFNGQCVVSNNDVPLSCSKSMELLSSFVPFELNRKPLISKIITALEKKSATSEYWEKTGGLLNTLSEYLGDLSFDFPCDIIFDKVSIGGIIKAASPELRDDYTSLGEKIIDYFELVRTFDNDKLFLTVNLRSYINDDELHRFMETVLSHDYHVIMLESADRPRLDLEERLIIDVDLCEIDG